MFSFTNVAFNLKNFFMGPITRGILALLLSINTTIFDQLFQYYYVQQL